MSEPETDDTTQTHIGARPQRARRSERSYYYDDATGYEVYDPERDEEEGAEEDCQKVDQGSNEESE